MFPRIKKTGPYQYLQIVENRREGRRSVQRVVVVTLGRVDDLKAGGDLDALVWGLARFTGNCRCSRDTGRKTWRRGFLKVWVQNSCSGGCHGTSVWMKSLKGLISGRKFEFDVERAGYLLVLHRLFESGSDGRAERWRQDVAVPGDDEMSLHHLYRAMRWLGEVREDVEEHLYARRRDLFTLTSLCFFDTTSLMFDGGGG